MRTNVSTRIHCTSRAIRYGWARSCPRLFRTPGGRSRAVDGCRCQWEHHIGAARCGPADGAAAVLHTNAQSRLSNPVMSQNTAERSGRPRREVSRRAVVVIEESTETPGTANPTHPPRRSRTIDELISFTTQTLSSALGHTLHMDAPGPLRWLRLGCIDSAPVVLAGSLALDGMCLQEEHLLPCRIATRRFGICQQPADCFPRAKRDRRK